MPQVPAGATGPTSGQARRPNILLLMADQHRADAIGAARPGEVRPGEGRPGAGEGKEAPALRTPHLDRLCREGVRFARAYTESPVCVSARATLLSGRLPHRSGVFDNGYRLSPELPTLPALLRQRGYHGQAIGKMHFSPVREQHGLHRMWLSEEIPATPAEDEFLAHLLDAGWGHVEEPHGVRHEMYYLPQVSQLPQELHTTAWTGQRTVAYLEERARERGRGRRRHKVHAGGRTQPFFCWTSFIKPHPPFDPPVPWHTLYRPTDLPLGLPVRTADEPARHTYYHRTQNRFKWTGAQPDSNLLATMRAYYAASVSFVDFWVGQISGRPRPARPAPGHPRPLRRRPRGVPGRPLRLRQAGLPRPRLPDPLRPLLARPAAPGGGAPAAGGPGRRPAYPPGGGGRRSRAAPPGTEGDAGGVDERGRRGRRDGGALAGP